MGLSLAVLDSIPLCQLGIFKHIWSFCFIYMTHNSHKNERWHKPCINEVSLSFCTWPHCAYHPLTRRSVFFVLFQLLLPSSFQSLCPVVVVLQLVRAPSWALLRSVWRRNRETPAVYHPGLFGVCQHLLCGVCLAESGKQNRETVYSSEQQSHGGFKRRGEVFSRQISRRNRTLGCGLRFPKRSHG